MPPRLIALVLLVLFAAPLGCGGGEGTTAATSTAVPETTTTVPATTTTVVTAEAFTAAMCAAGFSIADAKPGAAGGYKLAADTYGAVAPSPEKKADLDAFVEVNRQLHALWSDPNPTTTEAFAERYNKLTDTYLAAIEKLQVPCPPQPGVTTTVAVAIKATSRLYEVLRNDGGKGLWWYTQFACPEGKKVKLGDALKSPKGLPDVGAVLDEAAGAAEPFTGVLANESYGRIDEKITATCV